jgi:hypothetical protein
VVVVVSAEEEVEEVEVAEVAAIQAQRREATPSP